MLDPHMELLYSKARQLDSILLTDHPFSVFEEFYKSNIVEIHSIICFSVFKEKLFSAGYLNKYSRSKLRTIYVHICFFRIFNYVERSSP